MTVLYIELSPYTDQPQHQTTAGFTVVVGRGQQGTKVLQTVAVIEVSGHNVHRSFRHVGLHSVRTRLWLISVNHC